MKITVSQGNSKVPFKNVSLTPGASCKGCAQTCLRDCYAMKSFRQYKNVRSAWSGNLETAKNNPDMYFTSIIASLLRYRKTFFRWQVAGDIISRRYLLGMVHVSVLFPRIKFLCFTKQHALINRYLSDGQSISGNLQIILSAWPGKRLNKPHKLPVAWMQDGTEKRVPKTARRCPGSCATCQFCWAPTSDVILHKH